MAIKTRRLSADYLASLTSVQRPSSCSSCSESSSGPCDGTLGYASIYGPTHTTADIQEAYCKIKYRFGNLCGYGRATPSTQPAQSTAYFQLTQPGFGNAIQVGVSTNRNSGMSTYERQVYLELWVGNSISTDKDYLPLSLSDGDSVEFYLIFLASKWHIYYRLTPGSWTEFPHSPLSVSAGNVLSKLLKCSGEVENSQDDMPGTQANPCTITGCVYSTGGGLLPAGFAPNTNVLYTPPSTCPWYVNALNSTDIVIWDWCPLP
jgi:hypothetical protein